MAGSVTLTQRPEWKALQAHYQQVKGLHLRKLFADDAKRGERFDRRGGRPLLDYSKHRITDETLPLLVELAEACGLRERIDAMFRGEKINVTEQRAVLHVALRVPSGTLDRRRRRERRAGRARGARPDGDFADGCAAARGRATPASASATSSTSASAAPISGR